MRKISMMLLASAALAVAVPAAAQSYDRYGNGYSQRSYDQRGYDQRGWGRDGGYGVQGDLQQLNDRVQADFERQVIGKRVAKAFFNRIRELQRADNRAREKSGGRLDYRQSRDLQVAVAQVERDLRQNEAQYGGGYGYRNNYDRRY